MKLLDESLPIPIYIREIGEGCERRREREDDAVSQLVAEAFGEKAERRHDAVGAPIIYSAGEILDVKVSISHSQKIAALAIAPSDMLVGIDIESDRAQLARVASRVLSEPEVEYYRTIPQGFLKAWTLKEALYKAVRGIAGEEIDFAKQLILPLSNECHAAFANKEGKIVRTLKIKSLTLPHHNDTMLSIVYASI